MSNQNIQPVFILPEGYTRNQGRTAHKANIAAAKAVADTVRTTLGPKGMDKMIVSGSGRVTITNDGVTILDEMEIEHPAAKMLVEVAKVQEAEVGDGTTTAVILAGELLSKAEQLLDKNIHPTVIAKGYELAAGKTQELINKLSEKISIKDKSLLIKIASTAMTGKNVEYETKQKLSKMAVQAIMSVAERHGNEITIDLNDIKIEKKPGADTEDSKLIEGIVIDKERVHSSMPREVKNAKVLLFDAALEVKDTEIDAKIQITSPSQVQEFIEQEESMLRSMVELIKNAGVTAVFCQKGIDDTVQHLLAKNNIFAVRRVRESNMKRLAKATSGRIITSLKDLEKTDLGKAGLISERKISDEHMIFVEKCSKAKAVTLLVRGGTDHVISEVERALTDAIGDIAAAISTKQVVAGGSAIELELSKHLRKYAESFSGREQLAVIAFSEALEVIPITLAENAGLDPIDTLAQLKAKHESKNKWAGLNVITGKVEDMWKKGVIEPSKIKTQAISSSSDVAIMLLRIDDIISAQGKPQQLPDGTQFQ
ncbi:MAG: thermosome subunit [uncultured DHVE6 group euryarchaeote]|jgi:thermosome|nr:MAG: thermosome subunit [uncultured DHVE6 group euryarchaeote]